MALMMRLDSLTYWRGWSNQVSVLYLCVFVLSVLYHRLSLLLSVSCDFTVWSMVMARAA